MSCTHGTTYTGADGWVHCRDCGWVRGWWTDGNRWRPQWALTHVDPIDTVETEAIVSGRLVRFFDTSYPPPPVDYRAARQTADHFRPLREAAAHLRMSASQLSDLETGRATLPSDQAEAALRLLREPR